MAYKATCELQTHHHYPLLLLSLHSQAAAGHTAHLPVLE